MFLCINIHSCPTINTIFFTKNIVAIGDKTKVSFALKPLEDGDWPSNDQFDFWTDSENGDGYRGSKVENEYEFTCGAAGIFDFKGIAYGTCDGKVAAGPISGTGQLIVVKVVRIIPDFDTEQLDPAIQKVAAVATREENDFLDFLVEFEPNIEEEQIPESFKYTGGQDGDFKDFRKAPRDKAGSYSFEATLGTSSAKMDLDVVEIDRIKSCSGANIGSEFTIEVTTKPTGYEDKVSFEPLDETQLSIYQKEDKKWYGKGLIMGYRHSFEGVLTIGSESFKKQDWISICDVPISFTKYRVFTGLADVVPLDIPVFPKNHYKVPTTPRTTVVIGTCDWDSITDQAQKGIFKDVKAYIRITGAGMNAKTLLGDSSTIIDPWNGTIHTLYANSVQTISDLTVGETFKVETYVDTCGEEKIIETRNFVVISYEDWKNNELPNITE